MCASGGPQRSLVLSDVGERSSPRGGSPGMSSRGGDPQASAGIRRLVPVMQLSKTQSPQRRLRRLIPEAETEADRSDASRRRPAAERRVEAGEGLPVNPTE